MEATGSGVKVGGGGWEERTRNYTTRRKLLKSPTLPNNDAEE
jgi:hypothetical protein